MQSCPRVLAGIMHACILRLFRHHEHLFAFWFQCGAHPCRGILLCLAMGPKKSNGLASDALQPSTLDEGMLAGLSEAIANNEALRQHMLRHGTPFQWPSAKRVGVVNLDSAALNAKLLKMLVKIWVPKAGPKAKTIPMEAGRFEAGLSRGFCCRQRYMRYSPLAMRNSCRCASFAKTW